MIAKIYPDGHKDLLEKKDPTHPVRYFDIRKLTPHECYRLMGVPEKRIEVLLSTDDRGGKSSAIVRTTNWLATALCAMCLNISMSR